MPIGVHSKSAKPSRQPARRSTPLRRRLRSRAGAISDAKRRPQAPKKRARGRKKSKGTWLRPDSPYRVDGKASPERFRRTPDGEGKRMSRVPKFNSRILDAAYDEEDSGAWNLIEETKRRRLLGDKTPSRSKASALYESLASGLDSPAVSPRAHSTRKAFLERLTCGTLRSICRDLHIRCTGRKAELIRRIMSN